MEYDMLEQILEGKEKPTNLPFALLQKITDDFSEEREIGQGGFGTVYKGVLRNRNVAVKRIMNNYTIDEKLFYREVKKEYIYAEIRERLLCFEYVSNGNLQNYITDHQRHL
ncbi:unnamed protein product [Triticum turgidum subsp. durum]|uniref:Protein kinase domain-containing protein n=1 Tax=Triticum turgidum subsp. durum TaxID=4567 RepID=A0A9R1BUG7_TRITD|nr:unnamed protein product [Triticum turgidum subsp. durum]